MWIFTDIRILEIAKTAWNHVKGTPIENNKRFRAFKKSLIDLNLPGSSKSHLTTQIFNNGID